MQQNDYWIWESILPKWFCEQQISNLNWADREEGKIDQGNGNYGLDTEKRRTEIIWLNETSPIGCIAQVYINMANEKAGWNFNLSNSVKVQIGKYNSVEQGFYDWHTDDGFKTKADGLVRKLSISMLLSDPKDFEGGLFEFKGFEKQPELKQGSIIVFPSFLEHRVTPVTKG